MSRPTALIVEDDEFVQQHVHGALNGEFTLFTAGDSTTALTIIRDHNPTLILLDLGLPPRPSDPEEGLRLLREIRARAPHCKVIVCTDCGDRQAAVRAIRYGAYDVFTKPVAVELLRQVMDRAGWLADLEAEASKIPPDIDHEDVPDSGEVELEEMIGTSEKIRRVFDAIRKVATTDVPVLIVGESGTGKELTAKAIHDRSLRRAGNFVAINCGAIPETLLESELFGHEKGAFTGAVGRKKGKLEYAQGGTLFLDEIAELSPGLQVKLLRFLQDQTIERVGGGEKIFIDARILAASNVDLRDAIAGGKFRDDLYYRLGVVTVEVPPLRDRGEDVLLMAIAFLKRASEQSRRSVLGYSREAIAALQEYAWPGNVRELWNRVRRAVVMAEGPYVSPADLDLASTPGKSSSAMITLRAAREQLEVNMIVRAATVHQGNLQRVAKELGVSRPTVYFLLRKHRIQLSRLSYRGQFIGGC